MEPAEYDPGVPFGSFSVSRASGRRGTTGRELRSARTASTAAREPTCMRFSFLKLTIEAARSGSTERVSYAMIRSQRKRS